MKAEEPSEGVIFVKDIGKRFMEGTRFENLGPSDQMEGKDAPALSWLHEGETIALPDPKELSVGDIKLCDAIKERESVRAYKDDSLSFAELSHTLWATQGVRKKGKHVALRMVPSAGARHAFETILYVRNVEGLEKGLYRYLPFEHALAPWDTPDDVENLLVDASLGQKMPGRAAVTLIWVADVYRMYWRYGERGYRYLHLDAGHVCQNLYLVAEQLDCGTVAMAAFDDAKMNRLLGLDGEDRFVIYLAPLGKI